jgi:hypothetical protein
VITRPASHRPQTNLAISAAASSSLVIEFGTHFLVPLQRRLLRCQFFSDYGRRSRSLARSNQRTVSAPRANQDSRQRSRGWPDVGAVWASNLGEHWGARCYRHGGRMARELGS